MSGTEDGPRRDLAGAVKDRCIRACDVRSHGRRLPAVTDDLYRVKVSVWSLRWLCLPCDLGTGEDSPYRFPCISPCCPARPRANVGPPLGPPRYVPDLAELMTRRMLVMTNLKVYRTLRSSFPADVLC